MTVNLKLRYEILRRDDFRCRYCGRRAPKVVLHVDHVIPASRGGSDHPSNLVAACFDCNMGKMVMDGRDSRQITAAIMAEGCDLIDDAATSYASNPYQKDWDPVERLYSWLDAAPRSDSPMHGPGLLPIPTFGLKLPAVMS